MSRERYEVRVVGRLGPAARAAFAELEVRRESDTTVLIGELDQDELHALLDRISSLALELVDVTSPRRQA